MATAKAVKAVKTPVMTGTATAIKAPPPTPPTGGTGTNLEGSLTGADRDAYVALNNLFEGYGLGSLAPKIYDYIKNGYSADTISILLQQTSEYKQRFAGNEARKAVGLPVLTPSEYLATEASYRQIMQSAGLPSGFYDQPSDFTTWIGKNVSPTEIQSRVDLATQATTLSNPSYRQALNQMGISNSQLTAYFLDPTRALPSLQKSAATAAIGAEALTQGLTFDTGYAQLLATSGVTQQQAQQGYSTIADTIKKYQSLAQVYGGDYTQRTGEQATFEGNAAAIQQQRSLVGREVANFGGATGTAAGGLQNKIQAT
ncbi:MAG TPA: hypothetical protein VIY48_18415 [Candidatus Paceibacterota bacterium]